jgi:hypothetical protein
MSKFLISFAEGAMNIPDEEVAAVVQEAHAIVQEAKDAGLWVFGGGLMHHEESFVVNRDGAVNDGAHPERRGHLAGLSVIDVDSLEDALEWAERIAKACRCDQEVRQFLPERNE